MRCQIFAVLLAILVGGPLVFPRLFAAEPAERPAMLTMPGKSFAGPLPPLTEAQEKLRVALTKDVEMLAKTIGERNLRHPQELARAAEFIERELQNAGLPVERQTYEVVGQKCDNLAAEIKGRKTSEEIIVVGAHYDSVVGSPGANDNGSGAAALLSLARSLGRFEPERTLRFVAFVNEEPPYFQKEAMGSLVYARRCQKRGDKIQAMLSLETIGYYSDAPRSQRYPELIAPFYPTVGNFAAFIGDLKSERLVKRCVGVFRQHADFPSEGGAAPDLIPGVGWSDQWSFWQAGYPGVMVTDTAPFRYPHYHEPSDTPDQLDYDRMARVVDGVEQVVRDLTRSGEIEGPKK